MKLLRPSFAVVLATFMVLTSAICFANDQAMLSVTGNITKTNQPDKKTFVFSFDELSKLPNASLRTQTIWTPASDFKGPLMRDILSAVGADANAKNVEVKTHDNFVVTIPVSDFKRWNVILAHTQNGQRLKMTTKGPLWIMYPVDEHKADLNNNRTRPKLAWGVMEMRVY